MNGNGIFAMESATSGSVKRSRTPSSGVQVASCLVDGCNSDLSRCRDYHRRHKVCEFHSKTPKVTVKGQEQRFCQQCSRFHSLEEFDEGKRSCRKRLDGHNRRRRKPQAEPLHIASARLLSQYQGTKILAFDHQQIIPAGPVLNRGWGETDHMAFKFDSRNGSNGESLSDRGQRQIQFTFLQGTKPTLHGYSASASASELNIDSNLPSQNAGINQKAFPNCARSLLSSSSSPPETREVGLRHMNNMRPNAVPPCLDFDTYNTRTDNTNLNCCQGMFDIGSDASSSSGAHHKMFSWE